MKVAAAVRDDQVVAALPRILLVEDDDLVRSLLRYALEEAGYKVRETSNGQAAIKLCRQQPFDLIISNLGQLEQARLETISQIHRNHPEIRIIAVTGEQGDTSPTQFQVTTIPGVERILSRPFSLKTFLAVVHDVFAG